MISSARLRGISGSPTTDKPVDSGIFHRLTEHPCRYMRYRLCNPHPAAVSQDLHSFTEEMSGIGDFVDEIERQGKIDLPRHGESGGAGCRPPDGDDIRETSRSAFCRSNRSIPAGPPTGRAMGQVR
ncbi:MAG: hypothetical protein ACXQTN_05030 [Methanoculleaceae archaeon]